MNLAGSIDRNRDDLLRIVAALFAMAGLASGGVLRPSSGFTRRPGLPRRVRNAVLNVLRPAESAVRRLIVIAAQAAENGSSLPVGKAPAHKGATGDLSPQEEAAIIEQAGLARQNCRRQSVVVATINPGLAGIPSRDWRPLSCNRPATGDPDRIPPFRLFDPLKRVDLGPARQSGAIPCVRFLSGWPERAHPPARPEPSPDDPVNVVHLCRRLQALKRALDDLDGQAKRLARWRMRGRNRRPRRLSPIRPGWPPGFRKRRVHPVDDVLHECHAMVLDALKAPDTS